MLVWTSLHDHKMKCLNIFRRNLSKFWTRRWDYKYGNCFTFNNGEEEDGTPLPVLKATKPGPAQGTTKKNIKKNQKSIETLSLYAF